MNRQEPRWYTVATVNWETGRRSYTPWFWGTYWDAHSRAFQNFEISSPTRHEILTWDGSRAVDVSAVPDTGAAAPGAMSLGAFMARAASPPTETAGLGDWWSRFVESWSGNWWRR